MKQIAEMLNFRMEPIDNIFLFLPHVHFAEELLPINQTFNMKITVVEKKVDLLCGECNVQCPESFLELQIGDSAFFLTVNFDESLL